MIEIITPQRIEVRDYVWGKEKHEEFKDWPKLASEKANTDLPSFLGALKDEKPVGCIGFKSRQTSYTAQVAWWGGDDVESLTELFKSIVWMAVLEGRRRLEMFLPIDERFPFIAIESALADAGWELEGKLSDYDEQLRDVHVWSHVWSEDGIPEPFTALKKTSLIMSERTNDYRKKNLELFKNDGMTTSFSDLIDLAYVAVHNLPKVRIFDIPDWHGSERKYSFGDWSDNEV